MEDSDCLISVAGGVALLLWGARVVRTGLQRAFGAELHRVKNRAVANRFAGYAVGLVIALVLQSSTAVALMTAGFLSQGVMGAVTGLSVSLDLGSTLVVMILSFDVSFLSPLLIFSGVVFFLATTRQAWR